MMLDKKTSDKTKQRRARQARYRSRRARGITVWRIEVTAERYAALVELGFLRAGETDPAEGARAVAALLDSIELS
jgi:hypothetical protein